jgi:2-desacetyl-2-hydroxyethyl bacteriochlorophyllide A dehydrogenase
MKGQRVVWTSRAKVEIEDFDIPALGENGVLAATECTLISPGTERAFLLSLPNTQGRYPSYPGYSNIGRVVEVGGGVEGLSVGDRVASATGHTSHFVASPDRLIKIKDGAASSEEAVFFNLSAIALQGVRKAKIELGEPTLTLGQGLIGLLAMQLAKLSGALPVVGVDLSDGRLEVAGKVGADEVLNPKGEGFDRRVAEINPAVVIEATGHPDAVNTAFKLAGWRARVVLLASTRGETERVNFYRDVHKKGLHVIGAHNSVRPRQESSANFWTSRDDCELTLRLIASRRLVVAPLITHRLPGAEAAAAYQQLMEWDANLLGVVLRWN